jgi:hypothetical protein
VIRRLTRERSLVRTQPRPCRNERGCERSPRALTERRPNNVAAASARDHRRDGLRRDGLVCAKLDRLGRDVGDFADLLKLSTKERWALRLLDLDIDTSTSMGEAAAFVIARSLKPSASGSVSGPARAWP